MKVILINNPFYIKKPHDATIIKFQNCSKGFTIDGKKYLHKLYIHVILYVVQKVISNNMKIFIITLTKIELYDEPKKGKFTDTGILEVEPSSLALKLLSPAAEPNG